MQKTFFHFTYAAILFLFVQGCDTNKPIDREAVKEEMKSRELKKVSDSEIMEKGKEIGISIAQAAQKELQKNLLNAIQENGVEGAISFCNANALDIVKGLEDSMGVKVFRVSQKYRNPVDEPDSIEALILDAYHYNVENELKLEPSVQEENSETLLFTQPIVINNPLCLNCHGKIGSEITESTYDTINYFYPKDKAVNYELGQLRGMWSIRIPKKEIVNLL
jgi:hypothetical protein